MSFINQYFDKVLVISLDSSSPKTQRTLQQLKRYDIDFQIVEAINGMTNQEALKIFEQVKDNPIRDFEKTKVVTPGKIGCLMSHLKCYEMIKKNKWNKTLIFEDDIILCNEFDQHIRKIDSIPDKWKMLYLGASDYRVRFNRSRSVNNKDNPYYWGYDAAGRFAYAIKEDIIDDIIELYQDKSQWDMPGDVILKQIQRAHYSAFIYPNIIIADVRGSDLRQGRDIYNHNEKVGWRLDMFNLDNNKIDKIFLSDDFIEKWKSSKVKKHFYQSIPGWFDFQDIYDLAISRVNEYGRFVEVGSYKGKSTGYMAVQIINSGKKIQFDCIDNFQGHTGQNINADYLNEVFDHNTQLVSDIVNLNRTTSEKACENYHPKSLDFVFIDAAHDYHSVKKDIENWLPKVKSGGIIAGHDYTSKWPGVNKAVDELLPNRQIFNNSWIYLK